jgi:hypothetical protein
MYDALSHPPSHPLVHCHPVLLLGSAHPAWKVPAFRFESGSDKEKKNFVNCPCPDARPAMLSRHMWVRTNSKTDGRHCLCGSLLLGLVGGKMIRQYSTARALSILSKQVRESWSPAHQSKKKKKKKKPIHIISTLAAKNARFGMFFDRACHVSNACCLPDLMLDGPIRTPPPRPS